MDISREGVRIVEFRQNHGQQNHFFGGSAAARIVIMGGPIVLAWPIFQPQRGVQRRHGHHGCAGTKRGLIIGEGATQVSFTVGASSS